MRFLLDMRSAQTYKGRGVYRYVFDLFVHLGKHKKSDDEMVVLMDKRISPVDVDFLKKNHLRVVDIADFEKKCVNDFFDFWIIGTFIYFSCPTKFGYVEHLFPPMVLKRCAKIGAVIHDFIPLVYPQDCLVGYERRINFVLQLAALQKADFFLCNSRFTMNRAMEILNRPVSDFLCIYGGADMEKWRTENSDKPYRMSERKDHILYVGAPIRRKNYMGLVRAFVEAYEAQKIPQTADLYLICGDGGTMEEDINIFLKNKPKLKKHIKRTGFISDTEMLDLISSARATVFPSFYEGLGLPILESYVAGTPAFAAKASSTQEFVDADCAFDPADVTDITRCIEKLYHDESYCIQSLEFGRKLIQQLNWDTIAQKLLIKLEDRK